MRFQALRGVGSCTGGYDEYGDACTDFTPITNDPAATAAAINYLTPPTSTPYQATAGGIWSLPGASATAPTGNPSTGFSWGSFFQNLAPTLANDATRLGQQAIATPGTVIGPNGQVIAGGGVVSSARSTTAMNLTALMPVLLLGGGALVLLVVLKGRR